jgi:hypothetical protein
MGSYDELPNSARSYWAISSSAPPRAFSVESHAAHAGKAAQHEKQLVLVIAPHPTMRSLQLGDEEVNKDRLSRALDHLLAHKAALEAHLSARCGELFAVGNDMLLYDVTSTYFEGQAKANPQAQRGYSRDHRPDCKQVLIALVVTFDGFPLDYQVFAGNVHDPKTL